MFSLTFWAVTQPLGLNNPIAGFIHILPSAGLYLTQYFLECALYGSKLSSFLFFSKIFSILKGSYNIAKRTLFCLFGVMHRVYAA